MLTVFPHACVTLLTGSRTVHETYVLRCGACVSLCNVTPNQRQARKDQTRRFIMHEAGSSGRREAYDVAGWHKKAKRINLKLITIYSLAHPISFLRNAPSGAELKWRVVFSC